MATQSLNLQAGDGGEHVVLVNRLSESRSPYVRGHMKNPVAWQMWDADALALAKQTDRLLFVSVGYSACHWCHVMERESFENKEVAKILNSSFVPIKIDREERPDVDRIYMNYVQATTGGGGWPLNVFLTPDLEPLFGGTYWPGPESATQIGGHITFLDIVTKMRDVWQNQRRRCLDSAKEITSQLRQFTQEGLISNQGRQDGSAAADALDLELLEEAYEHFAAKFDTEFAGFGTAPKFPTPVNLRFLLRLRRSPPEVRDIVGESECENAETMVLKTLRAMWRGGIKDQIGHGFARYSVTRDWSLPHFEKMLYDQAQLLSNYLDAYLITKDLEFLDAVHDISAYLTSQPMMAPSGGFYSAEDADSYYHTGDKDKREGAFYVWTQNEFTDILGSDAAAVARFYGLAENGNISPEHDAHDELYNQNVLTKASTIDAIAKEIGIATEDVSRVIEQSRQKLLEHREKERCRPALDDKIIVSWNGLAIGSLARVSAAIASTESARAEAYSESAIKAALFIKRELYNESSGTLKRIFRDGPGDAPAFADDYAFLISGLIDLYEATFDDSWLEWADRLQKKQVELFYDRAGGGFFSTAEDRPDLILRLKDGMDNAEPSTNGITASNLSRLSSMLEDQEYAALAKQTVQAFEAETMQHPFLFASLLDTVVSARLGVSSVVITGEGHEVENTLKIARSAVNSYRTVLRLGGTAKSKWLTSRNELVRSLDSTTTAVQICQAQTCRLLDGEELNKVLG